MTKHYKLLLAGVGFAAMRRHRPRTPQDRTRRGGAASRGGLPRLIVTATKRGSAQMSIDVPIASPHSVDRTRQPTALDRQRPTPSPTPRSKLGTTPATPISRSARASTVDPPRSTRPSACSSWVFWGTRVSFSLLRSGGVEILRGPQVFVRPQRHRRRASCADHPDEPLFALMRRQHFDRSRKRAASRSRAPAGDVLRQSGLLQRHDAVQKRLRRQEDRRQRDADRPLRRCAATQRSFDLSFGTAWRIPRRTPAYNHGLFPATAFA